MSAVCLPFCFGESCPGTYDRLTHFGREHVKDFVHVGVVFVRLAHALTIATAAALLLPAAPADLVLLTELVRTLCVGAFFRNALEHGHAAIGYGG